jgi:D-threo-aldose 1-dehydrogenase
VNLAERRRIGRSSVEVAPFGLGTAPLGDLFVRVGAADAGETVQAALATGVTLFDTAPYYGFGLSEHRVGDALREVPRESYVLATKVGRVLRPVPRAGTRAVETRWVGGLAFDPDVDYGYDAVLRSHEDSLQRLGLPSVELLAVHDLDDWHFDADAFEDRLRELEGGARALTELRASGAVAAVGLGINTIGAIPRVLDVVELDYAIVALAYTLLDQPALDEELPLCLERDVSVIVGAPFASGILAAADDGPYRYEAAPEAVRDKVRRMRAVCERHGVPLAAAALQFPLGHPAVAAVIPGAISAEQVRENAAHFASDVPAAVWEELKAEGLLRADAPVPS